MPNRWKAMNFGGTQLDPSSVTSFDPKFFQRPPRHIEALRKLSRAGRADTERMALEDEGVAKVVWGEPEEFDGDSETTQRVDAASMSELEQEELYHANSQDSPAVVQTDDVDLEVLLAESQNLAQLGENEVATEDGWMGEWTLDSNSPNPIVPNMAFSSSGALTIDEWIVQNNTPIQPQQVERIPEGPPPESAPMDGEERSIESSSISETSSSTSSGSEPKFEATSLPFKQGPG
jgi:hypothetical protein